MTYSFKSWDKHIDLIKNLSSNNEELYLNHYFDKMLETFEMMKDGNYTPEHYWKGAILHDSELLERIINKEFTDDRMYELLKHIRLSSYILYKLIIVNKEDK